MKISRRVKTGCALALAGLLALPCVNLMQTRAAGPVIQNEPCKLTIWAEDPEGSASNADFEEMKIRVKVYKTANVDESGTFTSEEAFKDINFNVGMNKETNAETWSTLAEDAVDKLKADSTIKAKGEGVIRADEGKKPSAVIENLSVGMYLVVPEDTLNQDATVKYVFTPYLTALPSSYYTLNGEGEDEWNYAPEIFLKWKEEPQFGELTINKKLSNYNTTLGQTTCVFLVEWTKDGKEQSEVASITLDSAQTTGSVTLKNIPAGVEVKVTEIYSGASYTVVGSQEATARIVSEAGVSEERPGASVSFENRYNGGNQGGYGVTNHFEQEDGEWKWKNPTIPEAE